MRQGKNSSVVLEPTAWWIRWSWCPGQRRRIPSNDLVGFRHCYWPFRMAPILMVQCMSLSPTIDLAHGRPSLNDLVQSTAKRPRKAVTTQARPRKRPTTESLAPAAPSPKSPPPARFRTFLSSSPESGSPAAAPSTARRLPRHRKILSSSPVSIVDVPSSPEPARGQIHEPIGCRPGGVLVRRGGQLVEPPAKDRVKTGVTPLMGMLT